MIGGAASPPTCHHAPWALVRRCGDTAGRRRSTRMAYLTDRIVGPNGEAIALKGYVMRNDMTGRTRHPRRIEWSDVIRTWGHQPRAAEVRAVKQRLPVAAPLSQERSS